MTRLGLDSTSPVPVGAHRAIGSSVALRYLSRYSWKILKAGEPAQYRASGIDLVSVFEDTAQNALGGHARGVVDARFALWQASTLGLPAGRPIYFACDWDVTAGQQATIDDYFRGVASVLGLRRTGCYGGYWPVKRLFDAGLITFGWQTYAWSGGNFDRRCQVYQYSNGHTVGGVSVDFNHVFGADFGQWHIAAPKPSPPPKPAPPPPKPLPEATTMIQTYTTADHRVGFAVETSKGEVLHIEQQNPNDGSGRNTDFWRKQDGTPNWLSLGTPGGV